MLRKENYNGILIFGLALTLLIFLGFAAYLFLEDARVAEAAEMLADERLHHGREIFNEQCAALNNKKLLQSTHDDIYFSVIRSGVPSTEMPAWSVDYGGALTDEDIRSWPTSARGKPPPQCLNPKYLYPPPKMVL